MVDYPFVALSDMRVWSLDRKFMMSPTSGWETYRYCKCGRVI
jgi:starvation-inducible outer membrane lipoprotein